MTANNFLKKEHLKKNEQIKKVFDQGIPFKGKLLNIFFLKQDINKDLNRVAFIIGKRLFSTKVTRNRLRRLLREGYRQEKDIFPKGHDIILYAHSLKIDSKLIDIKKDIKNGIKKIVNKADKNIS